MAAEAVVLISICEFSYKHLDLFAEGVGGCCVCGVVDMVGAVRRWKAEKCFFL